MHIILLFIENYNILHILLPPMVSIKEFLLSPRISITCLMLLIFLIHSYSINLVSENTASRLIKWISKKNNYTINIWTNNTVLSVDIISKNTSLLGSFSSPNQLTSFSVNADGAVVAAGGSQTICLYIEYADINKMGCIDNALEQFEQVQAIEFTDPNSELIIALKAGGVLILQFTKYIFEYMYLQPTRLESYKGYIIKFHRPQNSSRLYFVEYTGEIGFFITNISDPAHLSHQILSIPPSVNVLRSPPIDLFLLSSGQILRIELNFDGSSNIHIFALIGRNTTFSKIKLLTHPSKITSIVQLKKTILFSDQNNYLREVTLKTFQDVKTKFAILTNPSPIFFMKGIVYDSSNESLILSFTSNQPNYQFWKDEPISCLDQDISCSSCDPVYGLVCATCNPDYIVNKQSGKCEYRSSSNATSNESQTSIASSINRQQRCQFGLYFNVTINACQKKHCQDPECDSCLFYQNFCNRCKNSSKSILNQGICVNVQYLSQIRESTQAVANFLSVPNIKMMLTPLEPFFIFLEDYWYYVYHDRNYSLPLQIVFDSIRFMNNIKLTPQFIDFSEVNRNINVSNALTSDYLPYSPLGIYREEGKDIQFLINTHELYTWNYFSGILTFIVFRIVFKVFSKFSQTSEGLLSFIRSFLYEKSLYKCLILIFLEGNLMFITFYSALQMTTPTRFNYIDRFNMIFAVIFLFCAIFFSFNFYLLTFSFCKKKQAQIFLSYTKNQIKGYLCETLIILKNLFSGFTHAYLITHYNAQIICLVLIKFSVLMSIIILRKTYLNKGILFSILLYLGGSLTLDIFLCFDHENSEELTVLSVVQISIICTMCLASLLNLVSAVIGPFKEFFKYMLNKIRSNQIDPKQKQQLRKNKIKRGQIFKETMVDHDQQSQVHVKRDMQLQKYLKQILPPDTLHKKPNEFTGQNQQINKLLTNARVQRKKPINEGNKYQKDLLGCKKQAHQLTNVYQQQKKSQIQLTENFKNKPKRDRQRDALTKLKERQLKVVEKNKPQSNENEQIQVNGNDFIKLEYRHHRKIRFINE